MPCASGSKQKSQELKKIGKRSKSHETTLDSDLQIKSKNAKLEQGLPSKQTVSDYCFKRQVMLNSFVKVKQVEAIRSPDFFEDPKFKKLKGQEVAKGTYCLSSLQEMVVHKISGSESSPRDVAEDLAPAERISQGIFKF